MTEPIEPQPGGPVDTEESVAFELGAEAEMALLVGAEVASLLAALAAAAVLVGQEGLSENEGERLRERAVARLHALAERPPSLFERLRDIALVGLGIGAGLAAVQLGRRLARARREHKSKDIKDEVLQAGIDRAQKQMALAFAAAEAVARHSAMRTGTDITVVMAAAQRAVNRARAAGRWVANYSINAGVAAEAKRTGAKLVWVAERDACLHCLRYSGEVVKPGEPFPDGLSYAEKPLDPGRALKFPPLHPNCRCRVRAYADRPARQPAPSLPGALLPDALKREARRSVARGFSSYASNGQRLRAADKLIAAGAALPKTVVARARADVKRGEFSGRHKVLLPALPGGRGGLTAAERARLERIARRRARRPLP